MRYAKVLAMHHARSMRNAGESIRDIAEAMSVSQSTVRKWLLTTGSKSPVRRSWFSYVLGGGK